MTPALTEVPVYLEAGSKRIFAAALEWPGWCRSGRDQAAALAVLFAYSPRYARALRAARLGFEPPVDVSVLVVAERLKGDATTNFGAPGAMPAWDAHPLDGPDFRRQQAILSACWEAFDQAAEAARGKALRAGPRGGGRDLTEILRHALEADQAYLSRLGWKAPALPDDPRKALTRLRTEIRTALAVAVRWELPAKGPRGGKRWTPRTFIRRAAWHALDHTWEIEDRLV
jgi:hypothetical protein